MKIVLEHVRSFSKRRSIPIRPLTLLVGENSSGKSTFLSVVASVFNHLRFPGNPGFNEPPYSLGTFDTIATYRGGKYGRDETFSIGFEVGSPDKDTFRVAVAEYRSENGNVALRSVKARSKDGDLDYHINGGVLSGTFAYPDGDTKNPLKNKFEAKFTERSLIDGTLMKHQVMEAMVSTLREENGRIDSKMVNQIFSILHILQPPHPTCFSIAPIRSKPRRTYDEAGEGYSPEGDHIPTLLARLLRQESKSTDSKSVQAALLQFGNESGLFKLIAVKKLGSKLTDPFQIQVASTGPAVNLVDVGYGVSQALPIVVQSVLKATSDVVLLQQPEVHLHPRAQAALGTYFAKLASDTNRTFVIETHSDYLVDRVRQEVAAGKLDPSKVLILFFSKPKMETHVHELTLDKHGNIEGAPKEYRKFFLEEELNLFTRSPQ